MVDGRLHNDDLAEILVEEFAFYIMYSKRHLRPSRGSSTRFRPKCAQTHHFVGVLGEIVLL
jgi:hypothetical protein